MSTTAFPTGGRELVERMTRKYPELFVNDDDIQRQLTTKINEQFCFVYGPRWGGKKRAGLPDSSQSKDSQAVQESDGTTSVWDMFSSGLDILVNDGDLPIPGTHANLPASQATFMPAMPVNHLGDDVDPPDPTDPPPDEDLEARVEALEASQAVLETTVSEQARWLEDQQTAIETLRMCVTTLELTALKTSDVLKVIGKTEATWGHQHTVNLQVQKI